MSTNDQPTPQPTAEGTPPPAPPAAAAWTPPPPVWQPGYAAPILPAPPTAPDKGSFKRGFGAGAGAGLGLGLALVVGMVISSMILGLLAGLAVAGADTGSTTRTLWGSPTATHTVRAIYVTGTILADASDGATFTGGTYGYQIADQIDSMTTEESAGLVLIMNTPGGTINGSKAIADAVYRYQQRTSQKVIAIVQGMSASGGMYAMAGADEIIADHGSLIGSIGVIMGPFERYKDVKGTTGTILESGVQTSGGIEEEYLTMGRGKDFGNPYRDMSTEERAVMMAGLQNIYDDFVDWVATSRRLSPEFVTDTLGAHIFDPATAVKHGLIDEELGMNDAYYEAAAAMGVDPTDTRIITPAPPTMLEQLLGAENRVPGHARVLQPGETPSAVICGRTPTALVYHGEPAAVCG